MNPTRIFEFKGCNPPCNVIFFCGKVALWTSKTRLIWLVSAGGLLRILVQGVYFTFAGWSKNMREGESLHRLEQESLHRLGGGGGSFFKLGPSNGFGWMNQYYPGVFFVCSKWRQFWGVRIVRANENHNWLTRWYEPSHLVSLLGPGRIGKKMVIRKAARECSRRSTQPK